MANAVVLGEELIRRLNVLSARLKLGVNELVLEAIQRFLEEEEEQVEIADIASIQFRLPFKLP